MTTPSLPHFNDIDENPRPVFGMITEANFVGETEPHDHQKAQLMYVINGVLTVEASGGIWTVPPNCALWIPSGIPHFGSSSGPIKIASLYIARDLASAFSDECGILFIQPLLRELLLRFDLNSSHRPINAQHEANLIAVLMGEIEAAPLEPIHLPMPQDRRLRRLTEAMIRNPELRFTIDEWGARVGASNRTLSRLFQRETGMSFVRWRQQLHIGLALQRLAANEPVTTIAGDLGYESVSAFIVMFRRMLGTTPARYFDTGSSGGDRGDRRTIALLPEAHSSAIRTDGLKRHIVSIK